jgi:hypothetical protein
MEGDGVLCRPRCYPACNAHQKCSVPDCALEPEDGRQQEGKDQHLPAAILNRNEDDGEEEEVVSALAVRTIDITEAPLCDKPCR